MEYSVHQYTYPFHQLFMGLLAGFLAWSLRRTRRSPLQTGLTVLLWLSAAGCALQALLGILGLFGSPGHPHEISPRRLVLVIAMWLSPFVHVLILTALTVLVHRGAGGRTAEVLTPEARYGTGRVAADSGRG